MALGRTEITATLSYRYAAADPTNQMGTNQSHYYRHTC